MTWARAGRWSVLGLSVLVYAAAVSGRLQHANLRADLRGCVELHAVVYQVILLAGLGAGLAAGPAGARAAAAVTRSLLPAATDARRLAWIRGAAFAFIGLAMASNALWTGPAVNLFIDTHRLILLEADVLLYGMGVGAGIGWYLLLDRYGWMGALLMPAMAFMLVGAGFTGAGWCA